MLIGCGRVPDVSAFSPVLEEDGRLVELLIEADALAVRDPASAARNLREIALPRAQTNARHAEQITARHPRARSLLHELVRITSARVTTIDAYANALTNSDAIGLRDVLA